MCVLGVIIFTAASALCGLTPKGSAAEAWIVAFRVVQGAGGALMFPAALAIVVRTFPLRERGRALAIFFGIAGGLTAIGPILGGYLTQWTWRAIFWVNVPVALIALVLTFLAKPENEPVPARIDYRGAVLVAMGIGLSIFGLQQSALWGWSSGGTWACIIGGLLVIAIFVRVEMHTPSSLINVHIFRIRAFFVENLVLFIAMAVFIPVFFFASEYAQISLHKTASEAGLFLLYFFIGFAVAAQIGGRILDREGAKRAVVMGCAIAAVGFGLWASKVTHLHFSTQLPWIIVAGAGMGMMLGPANTDAVNRASSVSYGEATGITQTVRNYGASLGLAVLGTILLAVQKSKLTTSLQARHVPHAAQVASQFSQSQGGRSVSSIPHYVSLDFAYATQTVLYVMCGIMGFAGLVALVALKGGLQEVSSEDEAGVLTD
jgi:MFS family permease